jgi:3-hydroxybutyryl-CoA dehydrogenase
MNFIVLANDKNWEILKVAAQNNECKRANNLTDFLQEKNATAYFNLLENASDADYSSITAPIFINSVCNTLSNINTNNNVIRINGWDGFLEKEIWEIAGETSQNIKDILNALGKKCITVPDEPGFVSARTIAMIINEAFFALDDKVSTEKDIDIAMKLGTNYPYGPFEWGEKIGFKNIHQLLSTLSKTDNRYLPALSLAEKIN